MLLLLLLFSLSFQRRYYDGFEKVYPHLTAILDVKDGIILGISWDDSCLFCGKSECEENTYDFNGVMGNEDQFNQPTKGCWIPKELCEQYLLEGRTDCDLILYVVWTGTDSDGAVLQSSAYRFSAFPAQELTDRFSQNVPEFPELGLPGQ
jgi:hypothetical protein